MAKDKNLSTFAYLKPKCIILLEQMKFKYHSLLIVFLLSGIAFLLPSCLGSNDVEYESTSNAQIQSFSASANYDSLNVLTNAVFSIDQLANPPKIYTKDSLAYGFEPKNALLTISAAPNYLGIELSYGDSTFVWVSTDSVDLSRLTKLKSYAYDGTTREYNFKINVHKEDPNILVWKNISSDYIATASVEGQKTISLGDKFITYYAIGNTVNAKESNDGMNWSSITISGLPSDAVRSLIAISENSVQSVYANDSEGKIYKSSNGISWNVVVPSYPVKSIYGRLPSTTVDSILVAVNDNGVVKFGKTIDFNSIRIAGAIPEGLGIADFSAVTLQDANSYTMKYIVVSGGTTADNSFSNNVWVIQEKNAIVSAITNPLSQTLSFVNGTIFPYDEKLYAITPGNSGDGILSYSTDYGLTWTIAPIKQALPDSFTNRKSASVIVDNKNNIWIFGGISGLQTQFSDVWRGRINRLTVN